ncbi:GDSL-type esterase/lipase family protein [Candidatus Saccharibacteria bacterium]|nr:GDSL-type esterase/lipase family protein [Candidatus Saccharibacteria bacterium]
MIKILIYGDSNVWGSTEYDENGRLEKYERWAGRLSEILGDGFEVIEAGYPGRCAGSFEQSREQDKDYDGHEHYEIMLKQASPVDLVVIALGTNDLKIKYERPVGMIVEDLLWFEGRTQYLKEYNGGMPRFLYILPPRAVNKVGWYEMDEGERERLVGAMKERVADWVDLDTVALTDDGVHFSVEGHEDIANRVAGKIIEMFREG